MKTFRIFLLVLLTGSSNLYTSATPLPDAGPSPATIEAEPELLFLSILEPCPPPVHLRILTTVTRLAFVTDCPLSAILLYLDAAVTARSPSAELIRHLLGLTQVERLNE
ncbi:hypothetical protein TWF225_008277 [Orbilia oligospora]|nr:hypothetical protein TWF225_008277 [Orbilia oligospora]KAF3269003.1 hypothetical protein TWF217_010282 [Orbilia oligospora]KAF3290491.1 hypothetical protein TWF132_006824 [Orbilia oligospora]